MTLSKKRQGDCMYCGDEGWMCSDEEYRCKNCILEWQFMDEEFT